MSESESTYKLPKSKNGQAIAIIVLTLLLIAALGVVGYFVKTLTDERTVSMKNEQRAKELVLEVDQLKQDKSDLTSELSDKVSELDRTKKEWSEQVAQLQQENRERVQRTYAQMDEIVYDSRKTLEYIGTIEDKLKAGKALDEQEAEQIRVVANGLSFLQQQYQKPIGEFRELERYLSEQLDVPQMSSPKARYGLLKRIFGSEYKEAQAQYYQDQGRRDAFERARTKVVTAYDKAQGEMRELNLEAGDYLAKLEGIIQSNEAGSEEVAEFFEKSREVLKIHESIMSIEPEKGLQQVKP